MKSIILVALLFSLLLVSSFAGISRDTKRKVAGLDPKVKKTVMGLQAQGVPKHVIADKIKMSVTGDAHQLIDGINYEDSKSRSSSAKAAKQREVKREQAVKAQSRR